MIFYDWISCYQKHDAQLPVVACKIKTQTDIDSGEVDYDMFTHLKLEGSYSSSCLVRCDGNTVYFSGNPSRWNRHDNFLGYDTIDACLAVVNEIVKSLGLPPFTKTQYMGCRQDDGVVFDGCVLTRVDVTTNFCVGHGNVSRAIRGFSSHMINNKPGYLYPNGATVQWYYDAQTGRGSRRKAFKLYDKARDLRNRVKVNDELYNQYVDLLTAFCDDRGILRAELSLKSKELKHLDLCHWGRVPDERLFYRLHEHIEKVTKSVDVNFMHYQHVENVMIEKGFSRGQARSFQATVLRWASGEPCNIATMGKTTYYRHRKVILEHIGIDIGATFEITRMPIRVDTIVLRPLSASDMPEWYRFAA